MAAFAVREACAATRATGQGRKAKDKEQYRVESLLCMYVGSVRLALSTTVCVFFLLSPNNSPPALHIPCLFLILCLSSIRLSCVQSPSIVRPVPV
jgi:hypothetical protein